jgi:glycosyltransferase involved in cell wall biosynthesis
MGPPLRVLVISNLYPPYYVGGYELACHDVVNALRQRGHDIRVLTSTYKSGGRRTDGHVYRVLQVHIQPATFVVEAVRLIAKEMVNQHRFRLALDEVRPQAVHVWNLWGASVSIPLLAQQNGCPVGFLVSDNWLAQWEKDPWYRVWNGPVPALVAPGKPVLRLLVRALGLLTAGTLDLRHVQCTSLHLCRQLLDAGKPLGSARVVYWGVDPDRYQFQPVHREPRRLLYAGQVIPHKGLHLALDALAILVATSRGFRGSLSVAGGSIRPDYLESVKQQVSRLGLQDRVQFLGPVPRDRMPALYRDHDVLLFPSMWDEPFSITVLEAMAAGLAIVASATGGTPEAVRDGENGLLFPRGDAPACARAVARLVADPSLFASIRDNARRTIETRFRFSTTVDLIEEALRDLVAGSTPCERP